MTEVAADTPHRPNGAGGGRPSLRWWLVTGGAWLFGAISAYFFWIFLNHGVHGLDSHAYWLTGHRGRLYNGGPGSYDAYLYSPAFAMIIYPITQLPWPAFLWVWMIAEAVAFGWLLAPLGIRWGVPAFCLCLIEISVGNIYSFLAVASVVGLRRPAAWALPLLTKITPGLGPVWFGVRREWRALAISLGATAAIALASLALSPHLWFDWIRFLLHSSNTGQWLLPVRVVGGLAITAVAAIKGKPWLLAPAMLVSNPVLVHSWMALSLCAAIPRLRMLGKPSPSDPTAHGSRPAPTAKPGHAI